ncbi:MAG: sigma-54 dependent transcriptional regulator [Ignavibacteriales bacterium]|nr:sigma-54 dependent transcriptional regulator [Ignavibacteriales bacterium]
MSTDERIQVLLIEDEEFDVRRVRSTLKPFEHQIEIRDVVSNGDSALELLEHHTERYDVVIMDLQIAGGTMGELLIRAIKRIAPLHQIIVITKMTVNITDFDFANRLLQAGAFWYCTKYPSDIENYIYQPTDFILSIFNAYQRKKLEREKSRSEKKLLHNVEGMLSRTKILGVSEQIQKIRAQIKQLAVTDATVLISGASGTGKELVAINIHYESKRKLENFVPINCGSIPDELIESELFGYEKGAFTGANANKRGLFEQANHGTIFLDEVAELPLAAQVKLLRVIQDGEIEKIGRVGEKVKVDVRIIAATNKMLQQEIAAGRFREDLFFRLHVVPLHISPLKERPEDILVLWEHFMRKMSIDMIKSTPSTEEAAFDVLKKYDWPGNVRELENVVQRLLLREENIITSKIIEEVLSLHPLSPNAGSDTIVFQDSENVSSLREMECVFRKKYFEFIRKHSSSDAEAARKLGLAPPNFHRMCKKLGLKS